MSQGWDFRCGCPRCEALQDLSLLGKVIPGGRFGGGSKFGNFKIDGLSANFNHICLGIQDDTRRFSCHGLRFPPVEPGSEPPTQERDANVLKAVEMTQTLLHYL